MDGGGEWEDVSGLRGERGRVGDPGERLGRWWWIGGLGRFEAADRTDCANNPKKNEGFASSII